MPDRSRTHERRKRYTCWARCRAAVGLWLPCCLVKKCSVPSTLPRSVSLPHTSYTPLSCVETHLSGEVCQRGHACATRHKKKTHTSFTHLHTSQAPTCEDSEQRRMCRQGFEGVSGVQVCQSVPRQSVIHSKTVPRLRMERCVDGVFQVCQTRRARVADVASVHSRLQTVPRLKRRRNSDTRPRRIQTHDRGGSMTRVHVTPPPPRGYLRAARHGSKLSSQSLPTERTCLRWYEHIRAPNRLGREDLTPPRLTGSNRPQNFQARDLVERRKLELHRCKMSELQTGPPILPGQESGACAIVHSARSTRSGPLFWAPAFYQVTAEETNYLHVTHTLQWKRAANHSAHHAANLHCGHSQPPY